MTMLVDVDTEARTQVVRVQCDICGTLGELHVATALLDRLGVGPREYADTYLRGIGWSFGRLSMCPQEPRA
jgi:hypothetical protein